MVPCFGVYLEQLRLGIGGGKRRDGVAQSRVLTGEPKRVNHRSEVEPGPAADHHRSHRLPQHSASVLLEPSHRVALLGLGYVDHVVGDPRPVGG